jgi:hypothetical protein
MEDKVEGNYIIVDPGSLQDIGNALVQTALKLAESAARTGSIRNSVNGLSWDGHGSGAVGDLDAAQHTLRAVAGELLPLAAAAQSRAERIQASEMGSSQHNGLLDQVGGFFKGMVEEGGDTLKGLWGVAVWGWDHNLLNPTNFTNPTRLWSLYEQDAKTLFNIATHPGELWHSLTNQIVSDWQSGHQGEAVGRVFFELGTLVVPAGVALKGAKAAGKGGEAGAALEAGAEAAGRGSQGASQVGKESQVIEHSTVAGLGLSPYSVPRPINVENLKLKNLVVQLYHGEGIPGQIGTGSTADAIRWERTNKQPLGGVWHAVQKGPDIQRGLTNFLRNFPDASPSDRAVAERLLRDITEALKGN